MNTAQTLESRAAEVLGYDTVAWDELNNCWSGYGSSDDFDRSRDDVGCFVAWDYQELEDIVTRCESSF